MFGWGRCKWWEREFLDQISHRVINWGGDVASCLVCRLLDSFWTFLTFVGPSGRRGKTEFAIWESIISLSQSWLWLVLSQSLLLLALKEFLQFFPPSLALFLSPSIHFFSLSLSHSSSSNFPLLGFLSLPLTFLLSHFDWFSLPSLFPSLCPFSPL